MSKKTNSMGSDTNAGYALNDPGQSQVLVSDPIATARIKVMLVDDQTLVREGIRTLLGLSAQIEVVGEASDGAQAQQLLAHVKPDVVLMDVRMPGLSGIEVIERWRAQNVLPNTIILTTFDDSEAVLAGVRAGAKGYLLKDVSLVDLVAAIQTVHSGGSLVQPALTARISQHLGAQPQSFSSSVRPENLSERETEVLRLMSGGYSNKEVARALNLSEGTVKNHVSSILTKLGVRDRTRAVLKAIDLGWL